MDNKPKSVADIVEEARAIARKISHEKMSVHISSEHDVTVWKDGYEKGYQDALEYFRKHSSRIW